MKNCNILVRKTDNKRQRGASMVEYALLVALIAIIAIAAVQILGERVSENFSEIADAL